MRLMDLMLLKAKPLVHRPCNRHRELLPLRALSTLSGVKGLAASCKTTSCALGGSTHICQLRQIWATSLYLEKPVNPEELVTIVNELLKGGR